MKTREIMTPFVRCVQPADSLADAARLMREDGIGAAPVCDRNRTLLGFLTDRDIVIRATAKGLDPNATRVETVMSPSIIATYDDLDVSESAALMKEYQVRRLPVLDRQKRLIGIVSLADLAAWMEPAASGSTLRTISRPAEAQLENPANR